jgi:hypothetical protein
MCVRCPAPLCSDLQAEWFVKDSPLRSSRLLVSFPLRVGPWDPHLFTHMMRLLPTQRTVVRCPLLHTHRCIEQMPKLHFASNLFCLFLTQQPRCPSHISVASAWQCGLHRSDPMFRRTNAGAYVHFSHILPDGENVSPYCVSKNYSTYTLKRSSAQLCGSCACSVCAAPATQLAADVVFVVCHTLQNQWRIAPWCIAPLSPSTNHQCEVFAAFPSLSQPRRSKCLCILAGWQPC